MNDQSQSETSQAVSEAEAEAATVPEDAAETLAQRASHGEAVENHRHIAELWSAFLDTDVSASDVANCMMMVKMSRAKTGQAIKDHYVDVGGYSGIAWACALADGEAVDE